MGIIMIRHRIKIDGRNIHSIPKKVNIEAILVNIWTYFDSPFRLQKDDIFLKLEDMVISGGSGIKSSIEELEYVFKKYNKKYDGLYVSEITIFDEHELFLDVKLKFNFIEDDDDE